MIRVKVAVLLSRRLESFDEFEFDSIPSGGRPRTASIRLQLLAAP